MLDLPAAFVVCLLQMLVIRPLYKNRIVIDRWRCPISSHGCLLSSNRLARNLSQSNPDWCSIQRCGSLWKKWWFSKGTHSVLAGLMSSFCGPGIVEGATWASWRILLGMIEAIERWKIHADFLGEIPKLRALKPGKSNTTCSSLVTARWRITILNRYIPSGYD